MAVSSFKFLKSPPEDEAVDSVSAVSVNAASTLTYTSDLDGKAGTAIYSGRRKSSIAGGSPALLDLRTRKSWLFPVIAAHRPVAEQSRVRTAEGSYVDEVSDMSVRETGSRGAASLSNPRQRSPSGSVASKARGSQSRGPTADGARSPSRGGSRRQSRSSGRSSASERRSPSVGATREGSPTSARFRSRGNTADRQGGKQELSNQTSISVASDGTAASVLDENNFVYGRLRGKGALVVCFVDQYLAQTKAYKKAVSPLANDVTEARNRANRAVEGSVLRLQKFAKIRLLAKLSWK